MRRPLDPISLMFWAVFIGVLVTGGLWFSASYWDGRELVAIALPPIWIVVGVVVLVGAVGAGVRNGMTHALMDRDERARQRANP